MRSKRHGREGMESRRSERHDREERSVHDGDPDVFEFLVHVAEDDLAEFVFDPELVVTEEIEDLVGARVGRVEDVRGTQFLPVSETEGIDLLILVDLPDAYVIADLDIRIEADLL